MKKWRLATGVGLVLVLGMLIGSAGTQLYLRHKFHPFPDRKARVERLLKSLTHDLDLSQTQEAAVGRILDDMAEKLHKHYARIRPEVDAIVDESFTEVQKQLDEGQKKKFDALKEKYMRHRRPGP